MSPTSSEQKEAAEMHDTGPPKQGILHPDRVNWEAAATRDGYEWVELPDALSKLIVEALVEDYGRRVETQETMYDRYNRRRYLQGEEAAQQMVNDECINMREAAAKRRRSGFRDVTREITVSVVSGVAGSAATLFITSVGSGWFS